MLFIKGLEAFNELVATARLSDILQELQGDMLRRFSETHPDANKCTENLTLEGKLVWFCDPGDIGVNQSLVDAPIRVFSAQ